MANDHFWKYPYAEWTRYRGYLYSRAFFILNSWENLGTTMQTRATMPKNIIIWLILKWSWPSLSYFAKTTRRIYLWQKDKFSTNLFKLLWWSIFVRIQFLVNKSEKPLLAIKNYYTNKAFIHYQPIFDQSSFNIPFCSWFWLVM